MLCTHGEGSPKDTATHRALNAHLGQWCWSLLLAGWAHTTGLVRYVFVKEALTAEPTHNLCLGQDDFLQAMTWVIRVTDAYNRSLRSPLVGVHT